MTVLSKFLVDCFLNCRLKIFHKIFTTILKINLIGFSLKYFSLKKIYLCHLFIKFLTLLCHEFTQQKTWKKRAKNPFVQNFEWIFFHSGIVKQPSTISARRFPKTRSPTIMRLASRLLLFRWWLMIIGVECAKFWWKNPESPQPLFKLIICRFYFSSIQQKIFKHLRCTYSLFLKELKILWKIFSL